MKKITLKRVDTMKKPLLRSISPMWILMAVTFASITVTGIIFRQSLFRMIPLYVSMVIGMLQTRANRYASLMGGINSLLYAAVYYHLSLYASAAYALLVSCPIQLVTFIRWSKNAYKQTTVFRRMTGRQRFWVTLATAAAFAVLYVVLAAAGSGYQILDNASTLLGILVAFLTMFAFIEYAYLGLVSGVVSILLNAVMTVSQPEQITYLIFSVYSFICIIRAFSFVRRTYREQQEMKG